jgi:hypothetical protein
MAATATLAIDRLQEAMPARGETVARLAYPYRYAGSADPHLTGQPCDVLAAASKSTGVDGHVVAFACGCRRVVPGWTLSPNSAGVQ